MTQLSSSSVADPAIFTAAPDRPFGRFTARTRRRRRAMLDLFAGLGFVALGAILLARSHGHLGYLTTTAGAVQASAGFGRLVA